MTSNNLCAFREDTRFSSRDVKHHTIPELPNVTPIPNAIVNSGPDAEAFLQELTNYTEEVSSNRGYLQWYTLMEITMKIAQ